MSGTSAVVDFAKGGVLEGEFVRLQSRRVMVHEGNYMSLAMAPAIQAQKDAINEDTWGHLAPARNARYSGWVEWSLSEFGDMQVHAFQMRSKTKGNLESSPWLFNFLQNIQLDHLGESGLPAGVYRFEGYFTNYKLVGKIFLAHHSETYRQVPALPSEDGVKGTDAKKYQFAKRLRDLQDDLSASVRFCVPRLEAQGRIRFYDSGYVVVEYLTRNGFVTDALAGGLVTTPWESTDLAGLITINNRLYSLTQKT